MGKLLLETEKDIDLDYLAQAVYKVLGQKDNLLAELIFVSAEEIRELNKTTRGIDKVTDVLSYPTLDGVRGKVLLKKDFPTDVDGDNLLIGSIAMCM